MTGFFSNPVSGRRSLTQISDLSDSEVVDLLGRAEIYRKQELGTRRFSDELKDFVVATLFFEGSTRTRLSFTLAAERLGARVIDLAVSASSVSKGESLKDTCDTVSALGADAVVVRHPNEGAPLQIASWTSLAVVNAGDGCHEHPTQALGDLFSLSSAFGGVGNLATKKIAIVGDILHSRVARSLSALLGRFGVKVVLVGPPDMMVDRPSALGAEFSYDLDEVIGEVDVLYLLRIQRERIQGGYHSSIDSYTRRFQLDQKRYLKMAPKSIVMHPGPVNRGVELAVKLPEERSLISEQVRNGVLMRMAVFSKILATASDDGRSQRGITGD
ncbi:MAG: aspartate carbamoyltransferase catalytic subunit [Acidimicrobiaceae bacterium]|nr:aspartate carbamoyltransferase catalytic subunit [Acidimicrobiaceae bacterium]